jgi:TolA-binding protein
MKLTATVVLLGGVLALRALAADPNPTTGNSDARSYLQQLISAAQAAEVKAKEVATTLKNKKSDPASVTTQLEEISKQVEQIQDLVSQLEGQIPTLNAAQQTEVKRLKDLAGLLNIFLANKRNIAESGELAAKREELRANAISIAVRAELIRKNAAKLRI